MAGNGLDLSMPHLMTSFTDHWPCRSWTFQSLAALLGDKQFSCRIAPKSCAQRMETQCSHVDVTIQQFSDWLDGTANENRSLSNFNREENSCYIDYKYMKDMFADHPEMLEQVQWKDFGLTGFDGYDSTIWLSSEGANTPGHQDTYGFNLITQIFGKKLWILFPPEDSQHLYPTRVPYEESSIFTEVNIRRPDLQSHPKFELSHPVVVILSAGQTLYVPRHWWHYVESLEPSISINVWVPLSKDRESRLSEAITRCLASNLIKSLDTSEDGLQQAVWLNPTEELAPTTMNLLLLKTALVQVLEDTWVRDNSGIPGKQDLLEDVKNVLEAKLERDCLNCKEIQINDHELNVVSSDDRCTESSPGIDCADSILISGEAAGQSEKTSQFNLWKSHGLNNVDSPFHFDSNVKFSFKRKADFQQKSTIKKQKLESASCSKSLENFTDLNTNKLRAVMSGSNIFSLSECPFDFYLKLLDDLCRQTHCEQCFRVTKTTMNNQQKEGQSFVSKVNTEVIISDISVQTSEMSENYMAKCGSYVSSFENVCSVLTKSPADDRDRNINLSFQFDNEQSSKSGSSTSQIEEKLKLGDSSTENGSDLTNKGDFSQHRHGDNSAESNSDSISNGDFSQLSLLEVSDTFLSCVLHPEVVKMISQLFKERCQHRLRKKGLLR